MSTSEEYVEYIMDLLSPLPNLTRGKMFSGAIFKSDGVQVGVVIEDQFYFRIQEDMRERYEAMGSKPFEYDKKDKTVVVKAWYEAPEESLENPQLFLELAEEVLARNKEKS